MQVKCGVINKDNFLLHSDHFFFLWRFHSFGFSNCFVPGTLGSRQESTHRVGCKGSSCTQTFSHSFTPCALPLQQLTFTGTMCLTSLLRSKQPRNRKQHLPCSDLGICFPHDKRNLNMTSQPHKFLLRLSRSFMEPRVSKTVWLHCIFSAQNPQS